MRFGLILRFLDGSAMILVVNMNIMARVVYTSIQFRLSIDSGISCKLSLCEPVLATLRGAVCILRKSVLAISSGHVC
jgi:hypothetical protein